LQISRVEKVSTIGLETARQRDPDIHTVVKRVNVPHDLVDIYFQPTSYPCWNAA
jgi:hypothetical protein